MPSWRALAVEQVIIRLIRLLDGDDAEGVGAAFGPDGLWHHGGRVRTGRAEVIDEMCCRPDGRRVIHLISNFLVEEIRDGSARTAFDVLAFAAAERPGRAPVELALPIAIDDYEARLDQIEGRWLVSELRSERLVA